MSENDFGNMSDEELQEHANRLQQEINKRTQEVASQYIPYQERMRRHSELRTQKWKVKKDKLKKWLTDNKAPEEIIKLFEKLAIRPTYTWC